MKLSYRGVSYNYNPPAELTVSGEVMGQYRGVAWREAKLVAPVPAQPAAVLCYRGVTYRTQAAVEAGLEVAAQSAAMPARSAKSAPAASMAQAHQRSILASLEHRIAAARNRGDERLVHLLEDEMRHFA